jgi:folate-dependent tRNA-U54 methylase TrmFO/GidA
MNVNYGLFPPLKGSPRLRKHEKNQLLAERALAALEPYRRSVGVVT